MKKPKIYRVVWGTIEVSELISEAPKSFLVVNKHGHQYRSWKHRKWGGVTGGGTFQTERSFTGVESAIQYAREQIKSYTSWAEYYRKEAEKRGVELEEKWGAK